MFAMIQKCFCTTPFMFKLLLYNKIVIEFVLVSQEIFFFLFDFPFGLFDLDGGKCEKCKIFIKRKFYLYFPPIPHHDFNIRFLWTKEMVKHFCTFSFFFPFCVNFYQVFFMRCFIVDIFIGIGETFLNQVNLPFYILFIYFLLSESVVMSFCIYFYVITDKTVFGWT